MPKTLIAKNIGNINSVNFTTDSAGNLTAINATFEVNYGTMGISEAVDILPELTTSQLTQARAFYTRLKQILNKLLIE